MAETRKRKTTSASKTKNTTKRRGRPPKQEEPEEEFLQSEVAIIIAFASAVLLFLSNFHLCGIVGDFLRGIQLGIFGSIGFVAPLCLFVGTCFYIANQDNPRAMVKMGAVICAVFVLCGLTQLIFGTPLAEGQKITACYQVSAQTGRGGGLLGGVIAYGISGFLGTVGAYLVLGVLFAICAVLITEKSLVSFVKKGGTKACKYAKEDFDRRKEIYVERQEERKRLREERKVRGVDLEATALSGEYDDYGYEDYEDEDDIPLDQEPGDELGALNASLAEKSHGNGSNFRKSSKEEFKRAAVRRGPLLMKEGETGEKEEKKEDPAAVFTGRIRRPEGYGGSPLPFDPNELEEVKAAVQKSPMEEERGIDRKETEEEVPWETSPLTADKAGERDPSVEGIPDSAGRASASMTGREELLRPEFDDQIDMEDLLRHPPTISKSEIGENLISKDAVSRNPISGNEISEDELSQIRTIPPIHEDEVTVSVQEPFAANNFGREGLDGGSGGLSGDSGQAARMGKGPGEITSQEGTRRVVTANGKIIETDTELLRKRVEEKREEAKEEGELSVAYQVKDKEKEIEKKAYVFPSLDLLKKGVRTSTFSDREYRETAIKLQQTLKNFGVGVTVTDISCGPSVTRYELHPEQGVKVSKIVGLSDDIKLSLAAADIRIEAPIPGKAAVGIEVPNKENSTVYLRDLLESENFQKHPSRLAFAVGKDIGGQVVVTDIGKMPHLLIAGATGSGKSVCINTLIMSIIYKSDPEDVKLIMVDPKVVELSVYNGIPHLLIPVVTDPKKASAALNWAVAEMTDRYKKFAEYTVRDLKGYNEKIKNIEDIDDENKPKKLPQIIIIIDELADLMMVAPGEVEDAICRLAQLARACGIHLVIATQRPSVNVITGLIKANVPSRIAFAVSSGVDSRTIIDMNGAEKLLGKGDMLFYPSGYPKPQRVQGAFVSDSEVQNVVDFLKEQGMTAQYSQEVENKMASPAMAAQEKSENRDEYFAQAGKFIIEKEKASIGMLQRMFKIGFNRAARIMEQLAEAGVVGEEEGTKPRKVLMTMEEFDEMISNGL